jgi:hypothetical protein
MKQISLLCLALASLAMLSSCCMYRSSQVPYPVVTRLAPGQKLDINFHSTSRLHYLVYDLTITPYGHGYRVTGMDRSPSRTVTERNVVHHRKPLLPVTLSYEDGLRLDRLFEYYRKVHHGGSMTVESTHVQITSGNQMLYREYFIDDSGDPCGVFYRPEILNLSTLVYSMRPENQ